MDDIVKQAMTKWPNVPHCYGWLALDARGNWRMRDEDAQQRDLLGDKIAHVALLAFINRNYTHDDQGRWYFQNGPQRVYVELQATPWIWRIAEDFSVRSHTGREARIQRCIVDEVGRVYLEAEIGFGLVHTQDMLGAADAIEAGLWVPLQCPVAELATRFGYVRSPATMIRP